MLSGMYSAATALDAAATQHEVISRNLAFAHLPGYRRSVAVFPSFEAVLQQAAEQGATVQEVWGVAPPEVMTDFTPGAVQHTGRKLDFAIHGDGFFVVDGPDGPLYTRDGVFQLNADGELVTADGLLVQGEAGPIIFPPNAFIADLTVARDGTMSVGEIPIGQLRLVNFNNPAGLQFAGGSLFDGGGLSPQPAEATVQHEARELSNVSAVEELVRMITGMRHYEAAQRALTSIDDAVQQNTTPQG